MIMAIEPVLMAVILLLVAAVSVIVATIFMVLLFYRMCPMVLMLIKTLELECKCVQSRFRVRFNNLIH